jgi:phospholipid transport system substrate-binding protein
MRYSRYEFGARRAGSRRETLLKRMTIKKTGLFRDALNIALMLACASLLAAAATGPGNAWADNPDPATIAGLDPTATVKSVIDQATAIIRDTQLSGAERDKRLRAVAAANFDFPDMARTTLGYHWREISDQQRTEFVPLFTSFMENVYLSKLQEYSVQKLRDTVSGSNVKFTGQQLDGSDYAEVHSAVQLKDHPQPLKVDYLLKRNGEGWKIYDLDVDSISVMANYRQQFNRVLNNDGYPALASLLRKKTQELGSTLAD